MIGERASRMGAEIRKEDAFLAHADAFIPDYTGITV
jgi:hypothetical protein